MKVLFIEAKKTSEKKLEIGKNIDKIHILYTIQYKKLAEKIKKKLGKKVLAFQQVLGCSKIKPKAPLLLIGSGKFHALQLALQTNKEIFIYNNGKFDKISEEEIKKQKMIEKGKFSKFLDSDNIGLLVSLKPGQNKLRQAFSIKKKLEKKYLNKKFYIFISDNINVQELENFPCFFINFACPGISLDAKNIINYEKTSEIPDF